MAKETIPQIGNKVLKQEILEFINTPNHRLQIALAMGLTENAIRQYIQRNDPKLTQYAPLEYIRKAYGSLETGELLEPQKEIA